MRRTVVAALLLMTSCSAASAHKAALPTPPVISASALEDPGLPSQVGAGPLTEPVVQQLMQYFEDRVTDAYSKGDADSLYHYLAGGMLTGNRATINVLNSQHKRNVLHVDVTSVQIGINQANRVTLDMTGQMTRNYFTDLTTGSTLVGGLPGPSKVSFMIFLDFNPTNHTWYWTGQGKGQGGGTGTSG
jgi:hypothetical protein